MKSQPPAIREIPIDRAIYAVDDATRTYRYARRNPDWAWLDQAANDRNKRTIDGYVRIFPDGRRKTFGYRPPYTRSRSTPTSGRGAEPGP